VNSQSGGLTRRALRFSGSQAGGSGGQWPGSDPGGKGGAAATGIQAEAGSSYELISNGQRFLINAWWKSLAHYPRHQLDGGLEHNVECATLDNCGGKIKTLQLSNRMLERRACGRSAAETELLRFLTPRSNCAPALRFYEPDPHSFK
jgi:hypothetical protein